MLLQKQEPPGTDVKGIVLRLGGLHVEMSFLGCIGHLMSGSGLHELMEVVYAENVVPHILSGKAISRAIRAHILVYGILHGMILSKVYDAALPGYDEQHDCEYARRNGDDVVETHSHEWDHVPSEQIILSETDFHAETDEHRSQTHIQSDAPTGVQKYRLSEYEH